MELKNIIDTANESVVQILIANNQDITISSGTAFFTDSYLISNNHIFFDPQNQPLSGTKVKVKTASQEVVMDYDQFMESVKDGSDFNNHDFIIFSNENLESLVPSIKFNLCAESPSVGDNIIFFGYPFGIKRLTTHKGDVSAKFSEGGVEKYQIDGSVNRGNSGGPVVNLSNGEIIGIMTRSMTGLDKSFDELVAGVSENIRLLESRSTQGRIEMFGIDPLQFFIMNQTQLAVVASNLQRSANVGIGIAYSIENVANFINNS